MNSLFQDLRYSLRQLKDNPGFSTTAVLSLALGIAATTAVFGVIYAVVLNPYPYRASDRRVHVRLIENSGQEDSFGLTPAQWQDLRHSPVLEDSFLTNTGSLTLTGRDLPEEVAAGYMTSNGFEFLGVPAILGRGLVPSDAVDNLHPQPVAVLGYKFWQRRFAADTGDRWPDHSAHAQDLHRCRRCVIALHLGRRRRLHAPGPCFRPRERL